MDFSDHTSAVANHEQMPTLKRQVSTLALWSLGIGCAISGIYFGWNLGLHEGGLLGMGIATFLVMVLYIILAFSYAELACILPKSGGALTYVTSGLGTKVGFLAGSMQSMAFVFATPALAFAIGNSLHSFVPEITPLYIAFFTYLFFTTLQVWSTQKTLFFQVLFVIIAVIGLVFFTTTCLPLFNIEKLAGNFTLTKGLESIFLALPFALWFFLGMEGMVNMAEETRQTPQKIWIHLIGVVCLLLLLVGFIFASSVSVGGWEASVYRADGSPSPAPFPLVLIEAVGQEHWLFQAINIAGLLGLLASFNGFLLVASRTTWVMARKNYFPRVLKKLHPTYITPVNALSFNMILGCFALLSGQTGGILMMAGMAALSMYALVIVSLMSLRQAPAEEQIRSFSMPFYPLLPIIALSIVLLILLTLFINHPKIAGAYTLLLALAYGYYQIFVEGLPIDLEETIDASDETVDDLTINTDIEKMIESEPEPEPETEKEEK